MRARLGGSSVVSWDSLVGQSGPTQASRTLLDPRERQFIVRVDVAAWVGITFFLVLLYLLPNPYRWLIWIPVWRGLAAGDSCLESKAARDPVGRAAVSPILRH
jgi:hypothetical protein